MQFNAKWEYLRTKKNPTRTDDVQSGHACLINIVRCNSDSGSRPTNSKKQQTHCRCLAIVGINVFLTGNILISHVCSFFSFVRMFVRFHSAGRFISLSSCPLSLYFRINPLLRRQLGILPVRQIYCFKFEHISSISLHNLRAQPSPFLYYVFFFVYVRIQWIRICVSMCNALVMMVHREQKTAALLRTAPCHQCGSDSMCMCVHHTYSICTLFYYVRCCQCEPT